MELVKLFLVAAVLGSVSAVTHPQFYQQLRPVAAHSLPQTMMQLLQQRRTQRTAPQPRSLVPQTARKTPSPPKLEPITKASVNPLERRKETSERKLRAAPSLGYSAPQFAGIGLGAGHGAIGFGGGHGAIELGGGHGALGGGHGAIGLGGGHGAIGLGGGHGAIGLDDHGAAPSLGVTGGAFGSHGPFDVSGELGSAGGSAYQFSSPIQHSQSFAQTSGIGFSGHRLAKHEPSYHKPAKYDFGYAVRDQYGNDFGHRESRAGFDTKGKYYVQLPDGRRQTVNYFVNKGSGYVANVQYEGKARFPQTQKYRGGQNLIQGGGKHGLHLPQGQETAPFGYH